MSGIFKSSIAVFCILLAVPPHIGFSSVTPQTTTASPIANHAGTGCPSATAIVVDTLEERAPTSQKEALDGKTRTLKLTLPGLAVRADGKPDARRRSCQFLIEAEHTRAVSHASREHGIWRIDTVSVPIDHQLSSGNSVTLAVTQNPSGVTFTSDAKAPQIASRSVSPDDSMKTVRKGPGRGATTLTAKVTGTPPKCSKQDRPLSARISVHLAGGQGPDFVEPAGPFELRLIRQSCPK